jgi:flavin-dependent dehydrogenase
LGGPLRLAQERQRQLIRRLTVRDSKSDVVIVGAGPAGAALAYRLATAYRLDVLVLEREAEPKFRIGETLPGAAAPLLRALGLLTGFIARCYPKSLGRASIWGSEELVRADSFNDPQGPGWRLDRRDFDAWLVAEAQRAGADVVRSCRLAVIHRTGHASFPWAVAAALPNGDKEAIATRFLVDATGRRAAIARRLGAITTRINRLVCTYAVLPAGGPTDLDGFSVVEAAPDGWFYATRLPSGARLVAYHTDSDLTSPVFWQREFADGVSATAIARAFQLADEEDPLSPPLLARVAAWSGCSVAAVGDDWAAIGDAACCFDPLSSQGLFNALYGALKLAPAIASSLTGDRRALADYGERLNTVWTTYRRHCGAFYRLERRWPDRSFWRRRQMLTT